MGDRIEFDPSFRRYTIWRVATEEREAYSYTVGQMDMMNVQRDLGFDDKDMVEAILHDDNIDSWLKPIDRRAAIEHTRKKNEES
jgi:hypothetical protein